MGAPPRNSAQLSARNSAIRRNFAQCSHSSQRSSRTPQGVPLVLAAASGGGLGALLRVQLCTLLPHTISLLSGVAMARRAAARAARDADSSAIAVGTPLQHEVLAGASPGSPSDDDDAELGRRGAVRSPSVAARRRAPLVPAADDGATCGGRWYSCGAPSALAAGCARAPGAALSAAALLALWRALQVGSLHAYHSVRVALLTSSGLHLADAGAFFASTDALALGLLPLLYGFGRVGGTRPLLALCPLVSLAAAATLLGAPVGVGGAVSGSARIALGALSVVELVSPILPLALMPANADARLGAAYGLMEVLLVATQVALTLFLGVVRTTSGFAGALALVSGGFAAAAAVLVPLLARAHDVSEHGPRRQPSVELIE